MRTLFLCALIALLPGCAQKSEPDVQAAREAIRQQIAKYAQALETADLGIASQVWENSADISFISPAVHSHGWEEMKGVYAFFGSAYSERKLTVRDVKVQVLGDAAWAEFYWHFEGKQSSDGAVMQSDGRETQVYRKNGGRWALVHVHYSGPASVQ
jgi:ketosteroid isomerase-like protein